MVDITPLIKSDSQVIQSYKGGQFKVSNTLYNKPLIVFPDQALEWDVTSVEDLAVTDFQPLIDRAAQVEVVLLGCGERGVFVPPSLRTALKQHGITIDAMDTGAACRTYNVLMAEGRLVAAALFPFITQG